MTSDRKAVLEYIQNLAVRFEKVQNEEMKLREEIYNNSRGPVLIPSSKTLINIWRMTDAFMNYTTSLGFTPEQIWAKANGEKSMKLKFEMTDYEVNVLKKALENYPKNKDITRCLLGIIEAQCESQKEKGNNND